MNPFEFVCYFMWSWASLVFILTCGKKIKIKIKPTIIMWFFYYTLALSVEFIGHFIGLWTWSHFGYTFLHAGNWWANFFTFIDLGLSEYKKHYKYIIAFLAATTYHFLQETYIQWVTHYPLFGSPYIMIIVVDLLVCLAIFGKIKEKFFKYEV